MKRILRLSFFLFLFFFLFFCCKEGKVKAANCSDWWGDYGTEYVGGDVYANYGLTVCGDFVIKLKYDGYSKTIEKWYLDGNGKRYEGYESAEVDYLGEYNIHVYLKNYSGQVEHFSEDVVLNPIIEGVNEDGVVYYGTDLYISGAISYNLIYTKLDGTGRESASTECKPSGKYGHYIRNIGIYTIKAKIKSNNDYLEWMYYEYSFTVKSAIEGLVDGGEYELSVSFNVAVGEVTLDGEKISLGVNQISSIGNHTICVSINGYSEEISFAVVPKVNYIVDGGVYDFYVTPYIHGGDITLNGEIYDGVSTITMPGENILKISGINGYEKIIKFTVNINCYGIVDGGTYSNAVSLNFSGGYAYINDEPYLSGTVISQIGDYVIVINGANEFKKTIKFSIEFLIEIEREGFYDSNPIVVSVEGGKSFLNGEEFGGKIRVEEVGYYTLYVINEESNKSVTKYFTIKHQLYMSEPGDRFYDEVSFTVLGKGIDVKLNGGVYKNGTKIREIGIHSLTISGVGNYCEKINFIIDESDVGVEDMMSYSGSVTPNITKGNVTLNGEPYDGISTINIPGRYKIEITASNGYVRNIIFRVELLESLIYDEINNTYTYTYSGGTATINDQIYESGAIVSGVGNYTIVVKGIGNELVYNNTIIIHPHIKDIRDGFGYSGEVTPSIKGGIITLNGESYDGISTINNPGINTIEISGVGGYYNKIQFSINLVDSGISGGGTIYLDSQQKSYTYSGGVVTLNGEPYESGTVIDEIGKHYIEVRGTTGFYKQIYFIIDQADWCVEYSGQYNGEVTPCLRGERFTLNNKEYDGNSKITMPGKNTLTIYGKNDYVSSMIFYINLVDSGIENNENYNGSVKYSYSGGIVTLNGELYESGATIDTVGNNTLSIVNEKGDYKKEYSFTIDPSIKGYNKIINGIANIEISDGEVLLDGNLVNNKFSVNEPGNHTIVINGINGYIKELNLKVELIISGVENEKTYYNSLPCYISGGRLFIDSKHYNNGDIISDIGKHTLRVEGIHDYYKEITFYINPIKYDIISSYDKWKIIIHEIHEDTRVFIDQDRIIENSVINEVGNHNLLITNKDNQVHSSSFVVEGYSFSNEFTVKEPFNLEMINGEVYVDGKLLDEEYRIDRHGKHEIKVVGTNGYEKVFTIEYKNKNVYRAIVMCIPVLGIIATGVIFLVRKRKVI